MEGTKPRIVLYKIHDHFCNAYKHYITMSPHCCSTLTLISLCLILTTNATTEPKNEPKNDPKHQFLNKQNEARTTLLRGLEPLVWNDTLEGYARSYADRRRADCALEHSGGPYGENIFWGSGYGWNPGQAAEEWVAERKWYDYANNSCAGGEQCGHYTQIVWRDSKRIGCAQVVCDGGKGVFMTCNYDPPGNYIGERPY
ncbi:Cuticle-degrading protease [Orobanche gracilis]